MYSSFRPRSQTSWEALTFDFGTGPPHPPGQPGRLAPIGPIDLPRDPRRLVDQLSLHVVVLGCMSSMNWRIRASSSLGILLGQDRRDGLGPFAMLQCIEPGNRLAGLGLRTGRLLGVFLIRLDLSDGGHVASSPGGRNDPGCGIFSIRHYTRSSRLICRNFGKTVKSGTNIDDFAGSPRGSSTSPLPPLGEGARRAGEGPCFSGSLGMGLAGEWAGGARRGGEGHGFSMTYYGQESAGSLGVPRGIQPRKMHRTTEVAAAAKPQPEE